MARPDVDDRAHQPFPVGRIQSSSLPDQVYETLLDMLSWGRWAPDAQLSIDALSQSLGVSATPIREALARLEATGMVRRTARRGYRVSPPMSVEQMRELVDARLVIECGVIERAMAHQAALLEDLSEAYERHRASTERLQEPGAETDHRLVRQYFEDDWSFHRAIFSHCANRYLVEAVEALSFRVHRMRQTIGVGVTDAPSALAEHARILEAVRSGDPTAAVAGMRSHLTLLRDRVTLDEA